MRRQDAGMLALHELQDRMHLYPGREEEEPSQGVSLIRPFPMFRRSECQSAKYIEGLENRLGRMEQLLKLSGLLSDQDAETTDLQTLEQKLVEKNAQMSKENGVSRDPSPASGDSTSPTVETSAAAATAGASEKTNGHKSSENAPNGRKDEAVEALSEAMCSLVTNNYGDTRYIGESRPNINVRR